MCVNKQEQNWRVGWLIRKLNCTLSGRNWKRWGCEGVRRKEGRMGGKEGGKRKSRYNAQGMIGVSYWVFSRAGREGGRGGREGGRGM